MFLKVRNFLAVLSLSLLVGGSVLAMPMNSVEKIEEFQVDEAKDFNIYNEILLSGGKHSYNLKLEPGKEAKIKFRGSRAVALKIQTPDGETKTYSQDKFFYIRLSGEGEYVLELDSLFISQYSLEVFNR